MDNQSANDQDIPSEITLRVIGQGGESFKALVVSIVQEHIPDLEASQVRYRESSGGAYSSVILNISGQSKKQLDALYRDLNNQESVVLVL
jgi:putative lipoic acid-binding regulatory protein